MRKYWITVAAIFITAGFATESQAQFYSNYTYNNNAYMNYAIASQKAKAAGRKSRYSKRSHKKKHVRRHARSHRRARR